MEHRPSARIDTEPIDEAHAAHLDRTAADVQRRKEQLGLGV